MPTIEITSMNSTGLELNQDEFDIAIIEEKKLRSHRGLFYGELKKQKGVIIHIGNPDMKNDKYGGFFAGQIIDWDFEPCDIEIPQIDPNDPTENWGANQQYLFKFLDNYKIDIDKLLNIALDKSPIKKVCFLTDYQFGPEHGKTKIIYTINNFWQEHDNNGLYLNTMYEMYGR
ncbi:MAG: hypothetical protein R2774_06060 [Saprospiraceae bacterium]